MSVHSGIPHQDGVPGTVDSYTNTNQLLPWMGWWVFSVSMMRIETVCLGLLRTDQEKRSFVLGCGWAALKVGSSPLTAHSHHLRSSNRS